MPENISNLAGLKKVLGLDQNLRKLVAEYYLSLKEMNDPEKAVNFLADHITIMVEMLNDFKKDYKKTS